MQSLKLLSAARLLGSRSLLQPTSTRLSHHFIQNSAEAGSYEKLAKMWGVATFVVAMPCIMFGFYNMEQREHDFAHSHPDGPALPNWEWNRITKPFPWGNGKQPLFEFLFQKHPEVYPPSSSDE